MKSVSDQLRREIVLVDQRIDALYEQERAIQEQIDREYGSLETLERALSLVQLGEETIAIQTGANDAQVR